MTREEIKASLEAEGFAECQPNRRWTLILQEWDDDGGKPYSVEWLSAFEALSGRSAIGVPRREFQELDEAADAFLDAADFIQAWQL